MAPSDAADSEARFDAALAARDARTLVTLYAGEADRLDLLGETDAACFLLTHAYVWALEADLAEAGELHARLVARGREE